MSNVLNEAWKARAEIQAYEDALNIKERVVNLDGMLMYQALELDLGETKLHPEVVFALDEAELGPKRFVPGKAFKRGVLSPLTGKVALSGFRTASDPERPYAPPTVVGVFQNGEGPNMQFGVLVSRNFVDSVADKLNQPAVYPPRPEDDL